VFLKGTPAMQTYQTEKNAVHLTTERLKCGGCDKFKKEVVEIKPNLLFCYGVDGCFIKKFPSLFPDNINFIETRLIIDADFETRKETCKKRRQAVTPKVRYRILKRDDFRCVLCGKTAKDVQLEVDHIYPVSKGGDSSDKNLRTLCADCNGGKSNEVV
jgi:hypothetical protein